MFGFKIITDSEYILLQANADLWKKAFEAERDRADRLNDVALMSAGRPPVSAEAVGEMKELSAEVKRVREEMSEVFLETQTPEDAMGDLLEPAPETEAAK